MRVLALESGYAWERQPVQQEKAKHRRDHMCSFVSLNDFERYEDGPGLGSATLMEQRYRCSDSILVLSSCPRTHYTARGQTRSATESGTHNSVITPPTSDTGAECSTI